MAAAGVLTSFRALLELVRAGVRATVRVEADDGGEEEAGLLGDELLAGGRGQLGLELQDLLLLDVGHLQLRRPHVLALQGETRRVISI